MGMDYPVEFADALRDLVRDAQDYGVNAIKMLTTQLCAQVAPEDDTEFGAARKEVLWIIKGLLISIEPIWRKTNGVDAIMVEIDKAIWSAREREKE